MKLADWVVRAIVLATFFVFLLAPENWGPRLGVVSLGIVGVWALLYPQGMLGWVRTAHPRINAEDHSLWWVPRLIGGFFLAFALVIVLFNLAR